MAQSKNYQFFNKIRNLNDTHLAIIRQILVNNAKRLRLHQDEVFIVDHQLFSSVSSNAFNATIQDILKINESIPTPVLCSLKNCQNEGTIHNIDWEDDLYICESCYIKLSHR